MATKTDSSKNRRTESSFNLNELLEGTNRIPPHNQEAEMAILGSILLDKDALIKVADILTPEHFYAAKHSIIFAAAIELFENNTPADLITLSSKLNEHEKLDSVGGSGYLAGLVNGVPNAANIEHYAEIIRQHYIRRRLIQLSGGMSDMSFDVSQELHDVLENSTSELFAISQGTMKRKFEPIHHTLTESFDRLEELHKNKGGVRGLETGFRDIDKKLAGLQDSNLIILAARPSVGKTSLALNICQYVAVEKKLPVGFLSLESSKEELVDRLLASESGIDSWKIKTGNLSDKDWERLTDAMGNLAEAPLYIDDTPAMSLSEMNAKARRLKMEHGCRLLVVDYLQLARGSGRYGDNRVQEVSEISQGLKAMARELRCPVIALSQLSRNVEQRGTAEKPSPPQLSDLRDSGSIEQDADVVMFLWREDNTMATRGSSDTLPVKLSIAKHRNGAIGDIDLIFKGARTRYYGVEKKRDD